MIADAQFVLTAQAVEDRETDAQQRNAEAFGGLSAMTVGDEQIGALGEASKSPRSPTLTVSQGMCSRIVDPLSVVTAA